MNAMDVRLIGPGMAKTFEDVNRGFRFRVVGDGRVEPELLDRFAGQAALEGYDDPRLKAFSTRQLAIAAKGMNETETRAALQQNLEELLGNSWEISTYMSRGGVGVARVDLSLIQPGAGQQQVYLDNRDFACRLSTTMVKGGWQVEQRIEGRQDSREWTESAHFEFVGPAPSASPSHEEYVEALEKERQKPGWESSQAYQAWLHWG